MRSTYSLKVQQSLLDEVRRLAKADGATVDQFINVAIAEKVSALKAADYLRVRAERANVPEALAILDRLGGEPPRRGDEFEEPRRRRRG